MRVGVDEAELARACSTAGTCLRFTGRCVCAEATEREIGAGRSCVHGVPLTKNCGSCPNALSRAPRWAVRVGDREIAEGAPVLDCVHEVLVTSCCTSCRGAEVGVINAKVMPVKRRRVDTRRSSVRS